MKKKVLLLSGLFAFFAILILLLDTPYRNARSLVNKIENNDIKEIRAALESGVNPNIPTFAPSPLWSAVETSPQQPLAVACYYGNVEIVALLLEYGASAEYVKYTGWSPLQETLFHYHEDDLEIVQALLQNGADPWKAESDVLPVFRAAQMQPSDRISSNRTYNENIAREITEIVMILLGDRDVNTRSMSGQTLLMQASKSGNTYLVEQLLACGADPNMVDYYGNSALDYAKSCDNKQIEELIECSMRNQ